MNTKTLTIYEYIDEVERQCAEDYGIKLNYNNVADLILDCYVRGDRPASAAFMVVCHIQRQSVGEQTK